MRSDRELFAELQAELADGGLTGGFLARDLRSGVELAMNADAPMPSASLVKVPIAVAILELIRRGRLREDQVVTVPPGRVTTPGPVGISRFRHPVDIALADLLYLSTSLSDGAAADALLALVGEPEIDSVLAELGWEQTRVRHRPGELSETPAERLPSDERWMAQQLAILGRTESGGHGIPLLSSTYANVASPREVAGWFEDLWVPRVPAEVAARARDLMLNNVHRTRLAPEFVSDSTSWWSKTGTLLTFRHEAGVVEHEDGSALVVVAMTESRVASVSQPGAEILMGRVARALHDEVRARTWG